MGPVRRTTNLVCALALTGVSAFALAYLLLYADGFRIWMPASAAIGTFLGLYWLWADFINADPRPEN
jgi:hypothetical protein